MISVEDLDEKTATMAQSFGLDEVEHEIYVDTPLGRLDVYRLDEGWGGRVAVATAGRAHEVVEPTEFRALLAEYGYAVEEHSGRIVEIGEDL